MRAIRLDREQLRQLNEDLLEEQQLLSSLALGFARMSKRRLLSLPLRLLRGSYSELPEFLPLWQVEARVDGFVAEAAGVDGDVAKLEIGVLRSQFAHLQSFSSTWRHDAQAHLALAVAALTDFYFGDADRHDTLLAQTQLVWMAGPRSRPLIASNATRLRHEETQQRYRDLWREWGRAHPPPALPGTTT